MSENPETKPEGWIDDKEEALEGAYAEKPYRDTLQEAADGLSEEAQDALRRKAEREGEKTVAGVRADRLARAEEMESTRRSLEGYAGKVLDNAQLRRGEFLGNKEEAEKKLRKIVEVAKAFMSEEIAHGVKDGGSGFEERIRGLARNMRDAISYLSGMAIDLPSSPAEKFIGKEILREINNSIDEPKDEAMVGYYKGIFANNLVAGGHCLPFLVEWSRLEKHEPRDEVRLHLGVIGSERKNYPGQMMPRFIESFDRKLEDIGFLWDDEKEKYIELPGPIKRES